MPSPQIATPQPHQYPEWASVYVDKVPQDGRVLDHLDAGLQNIIQTVEPLSEDQLLYRYEADKWTIKEMLVHIMDAERVFTYRGMGAARHDKTSLPGFDHNSYVPVSGANDRTLVSILIEYRALRAATIAFFGNLSEDALNEIGEANHQPCSARGMVYMIAGHERHHLNIIRERYLK